MKKFVVKTLFILLIISFMLPVIVSAWSDNMNGAWKYAYAYQLSVVKYDGTGDPELVGKPILIYHPNLMQDVYYTTRNPMPSSYEELIQGGFGFNQMVNKNIDSDTSTLSQWTSGEDVEGIEELRELVQKAEETDDPLTTFKTMEAYQLAKDMVDDKNTSNFVNVCDETGCVAKPDSQRYVTQNDANIFGKAWYVSEIDTYVFQADDYSVSQYNSFPYKSGHMGYETFTYKYTTPQKRITYHGSDVDTSKYYKTISDSNLTENNVNNGYLENLVKKYGGSVKKIRDNFGIDLDYKDIDKYYISVEPVQRILGDVKQLRGAYYIDKLEKVLRYETTWSTSSWIKTTYTNGCDDDSHLFVGYQYSPRDLVDRDYCGDKAVTRVDGKTYYLHNSKCYKARSSKCTSYDLPLQKSGLKIVKELYGRYADGYSYIETSRKLGSGAVYLNRAVDYCNEDKNRHCVLEEDNKTCKRDSSGKIIYEYYIGPDRDKGITGTQSSSYYKLNGACYNGTGTTGVKNYFLPTLLDCPEVCSPSGAKTSDGFLACAENYCEAEVDYNRKGSPQKAKEACILTCGYKGNATNCDTSSPYKDINEVTATGTTTCNVNDDGSGKVLQGLIKTCHGDKIDSFDGDDTNDTPFDIRKYITVACVETSGFEYKDTTQLDLARGTGLNYSVNLNGEKKCQAYFNEDQWKFDYATISGKDPDRRKRLLYIKEVFNNLFNDNYDKTKSSYYDTDFDEQGDGEVEWNNYLYDTSKVSIKSQVREEVYNEMKVSDLESLVSTDETGKATKATIANNIVKKISKNNIINEPINRYEQVSTVKATYQFNKRCVSNDGLGTVTKAPASGLCYQTKDEHGVVTPVYGQNVFYTNLSADWLGNSVLTYATVGKEVKDDNPYYDVQEFCDYTLDENPTGNSGDPEGNILSCDIRIDPVGSTEAWGNSIYHGGDVTATILPRDTLGSNDYISNYTLQVRNTTYDGKTKQIGISDKKLAMEEIKILGTVTSSLGKKGTCEKTIYIINPDENCGVRCNLRKINDTLYELQSIGPQTPTAYYRALSIDMTQRKVYKSVVDQKYYIGLDKDITVPIEGNLILFGIVEGTMTTNGAKCKYTCNTPPPTLNSCYALYKPAETLAIRDYCNESWEKDVNDYDDAAQCIRMCSNRCDEEIKRDLEKVTAYCRTNSTALGFSNENICINACYNDDPSRGKDYVYRPINNSNPFPNSYDSEEPNEKGKRLVGRNWAGFTDYIKHDDNDETSVTGVYANQHVEYIIDLSASDIERIQEDTKKNQRDGANPYIEYEYKKSSDNMKYVKKYESKFIHEDFADLFRKDLT